jgi:uncharacterized membrane protein
VGVVAKDFFTSQVGNMLGEIKLAPAILFFLLCSRSWPVAIVDIAWGRW